MTPFALRRDDGRVVRVGHRGAAALAPENSLEAIEVAVSYGLDAVELDVFRRADGVLVLAHGPELPAGAPALDHALALAARLGIAVQLDVKVRGLEAGIADAVRRSGLIERSFVSSFSLPVLRAFALVAPELPRALTYPEDRLGVAERRLLRPAVHGGLMVLRALLPFRLPGMVRAAGGAAATLNWAVVTPAVVAACHAAGAAVYVWTVNDAELAKALVARNIDGIIGDDPRIIAPLNSP